MSLRGMVIWSLITENSNQHNMWMDKTNIEAINSFPDPRRYHVAACVGGPNSGVIVSVGT